MRKFRIIIFDDDILILNSLKKWLSIKGYEVLSINEPHVCPLDEKKTGKCTEDNPCADVIITDYQMPLINGVELLQKQSLRGCTLDIRNIAIISGTMDNENVKLIKESGYSFFKKPIELSDLSNWLDECQKRVDLSQPLGFI